MSNYKRTLNSARQAIPYLKIMRSCQLDSIIIDKEIFSILKELFLKIFEVYKPSFRDKYQFEIKFFINLLIYRFSVLESKPTYGCKLQNLKYRNEMAHSSKYSMFNGTTDLSKEQKLMYFALKVLTPYLYEKFNEYMTSHGWSEYSNRNPKKKLWKLFQSLEKIYKLSSLLNFYIFLYNGKYTSIVDRLLKIRLVYDNENSNRIISNDYLSFQLVWFVLTNFLLFILPFLNIKGIKNYLKGLLNMKRINKYKDLPLDQCAICKENNEDMNASCPIHIPYITNCGHIYCYYCIKSEMINSSGNKKKSMYMCPRCSVIVKDIEPYYHYDDDDNKNESSSYTSEIDDSEKGDKEGKESEEEDNFSFNDDNINILNRKKFI
jgi:peroxin-2